MVNRIKAVPFAIMDRKKLIEVLYVLIAFVVIVWCGSSNREAASFHIDEAHKIAETHYYKLFFVDHDFSNPLWHDDFYARTNPPVAKYIMGAFLALHGHLVPDLSLQESFEQLWKFPKLLRRQVPTAMLMDARLLSGIFGTLTLVMVYMTGRLSGSVASGVVSALVLAVNPFWVYYSAVALTDSILLFFMTAMAPIVLQFLRFFQPGSKSVYSREGVQAMGLAIVVIAAAAGTKLNGALSGLFFVLAIGAGYALGRGTLGRKLSQLSAMRLLPVWVGVPLLSTVLFIVINPYLYRQTITRLLMTLAVYRDWMLARAIDPGPPLWTGVQKLTSIGVHSFTCPQNAIFPIAIPFFFLAFFIGIAYCLLDLVAGAREGQTPPWQVMVLVWATVYGFGVGTWIPMAWERYFLPFAPVIAVITAHGLVCAFKDMRRVLQSRPDTYEHSWSLSVKGPSIALSVIIALGFWYGVMDRSVVPPEVLLKTNERPETVLRRYEQALHRRPDNPLRMIYTGDMKMVFEDFPGACSLYEKALLLIESSSLDVKHTAMRAITLYRAYRACHLASRLDASIEHLRSHIAALGQLRKLLKTDDPRVRKEFVKISREREELLHDLETMKDRL